MVYDHWPTDFLRFLPRAAYGFPTDFCFLADGFCTDFCRSAYGLLTDYCFMALPWYILALIVTLKKYCVNYKWSTIIGLQISFLRFLPRAAYGFLTDFCFLADGFCTDFCRSAYGLLTDYCCMALPWYILALIVTLKKYCVNYKWSTIIGLQISYGFYPELLTDSLRIFAFWLTDFVRISAGQLTDSLRIIALWLCLDTSWLW